MSKEKQVFTDKYGDKIEKHDSFGVISVCKFSGGDGQFYGSDIRNLGGISITIEEAETRYSNHVGTYRSGTKMITKVQLTGTQFAEMITSGMNTIGSPCTIVYKDGKKVENINHISDKTLKYSRNLDSVYAKIYDRIDNTIAKMDGNIGKRKKEEIIKELRILKSHLESNSKHVADCFREEMDGVVNEAKTNISSYLENKAKSLNIDSNIITKNILE